MTEVIAKTIDTAKTADTARTIDMAEMPVQLPAHPAGSAEARARFFNSGNAFNVKLPPVPAAGFTDEIAAAFGATMTGFFPCDQSAAIGAPFTATTPLMLARYASIAPNDRLTADFVATGAIWYVIKGAGAATIGAEAFAWGAGDVFLAPGGTPTILTAGAEGAVLWVVTNEPQLAFDSLRPADSDHAPVKAVHYPAAEIATQLQKVVQASQNATTSGIALIFSSEEQEKSRNILPTLTLSLNTVPAGEQQRAHRHNSAAITLILKGEHCYSMVGGKRCDWSPFATLVTPATDPHSHHNDSDERAMFLIVQDGGLYYHARTMGFTFLE
ncbi:cupin domain-containing protein [Kaistia dalseonensis]|uniref:Quercetin dioxygenase-like cupin family protein n=1 Tax=Kaistia dalseonensis TaxID=410840 RepID=A0ABU0HBS1_9HYPH|nr:cupin domain-containing protein [Kaistia dalseonensis]MCX5496693.1 cupin domain-containing protein [Kaistia dalseonensis]MDQ0439318.1 quercetin dioxygenase-like cupin family protein [Kaistia dalseonensis]